MFINKRTRRNYMVYVHTEIQTYANVGGRLNSQGKYMHTQKMQQRHKTTPVRVHSGNK